MPTGYEVRAYNDLNRIAFALERIADALEPKPEPEPEPRAEPTPEDLWFSTVEEAIGLTE